MPRPERPLNPSAGPLQAFAAELRVLRKEAGNPKYLQMQRLSGRSRTALSEAAGGDHLPTWETAEAFVKVCGGDLTAWRLKWERVQDLLAASSRHDQAPRPGPSTEPVAEQSLPSPDAEIASEERRQVASSRSQVDILLQLWQEQRTQARQSENHRAIMTLVVVLGAAGGLGYVAFGRSTCSVSAAVGLGICLLGLFGALISAKYYERFRMHNDGAEYFHRRLDQLHPELRIEADWLANETQHTRNYQRLYRIRLHHLWESAHLGIAGIGAVVAILELLR